MTTDWEANHTKALANAMRSQANRYRSYALDLIADAEKLTGEKIDRCPTCGFPHEWARTEETQP